MTIVEFPLKPGQAPVKFKFTIPSTNAMEKAAGVGIHMLRLQGRQVGAIVLMTCYALRWKDPSMTEARAETLIQAYLEAGGKIEALSEALVKALNDSGAYGTPDAKTEGDGDEPDPTTTTETTETTETTTVN
jgi:hypothetical protein